MSEAILFKQWLYLAQITEGEFLAIVTPTSAESVNSASSRDFLTNGVQ